MSRPYVLLVFCLPICHVCFGFADQQPEVTEERPAHADAEPEAAEDPPIDYEKHLPDTPLNRKVAALLKALYEEEGRAWRVANTRLEKLFPDAVEPLLSLAENPECEDPIFPILCLSSGDLGPHERRVSEFLRRARKEESADRRAAALWITFFRELPDATTEVLKSAYADEAWEVREEVMSILRDFDEPNREELLLLVAGLDDEDEDVVIEAIDALDELGAKLKPVVAELRKLLHSDNQYVRGAVLEAVGVCGPTEEEVRAIYAACESDEIPLRYRGARALFYCDLEDPKVTELALKVFDAAEWAETRCYAARVLAHVHPVQQRVVLRLAKALNEPDLPCDEDEPGNALYRDPKAACLRALAILGPQAASAVPHVLEAHQREGGLFLPLSMETLRLIAPKHPEVLQHHKARFASGDFFFTDVSYLRSLGEDAGQFADQLLGILEDTDNEMDRGFLLEDLHRIPGMPAERLLPILLGNMKDEDGNTRGHSCRALGALGVGASSAVPELIEEINRPVGTARYPRSCAIEALGQIGPAASPAIPHLRRIYDDPETYRSPVSGFTGAWHEAAVALAKLDLQERKRVFDHLRRDLESGVCVRQQSAIFVIGDIGPLAASFLDDLRPIARDPKNVLCAAAAVAIVRVGDEAMGADWALENLRSDDEDRQMRGSEIAAFLSKQEQVDRVLPVLRRLLRSRTKSASAYAAGAIEALVGGNVFPWEGGVPGLGPKAKPGVRF